MGKLEMAKVSDVKNLIEKVNVGARFKQLASRAGKDAPSYWMAILGLNHRNQVYHRWATEDIESKELILICTDLGISISDFYEMENTTTDARPTGPKKYLEQQIEDLYSEVNELKTILKFANDNKI